MFSFLTLQWRILIVSSAKLHAHWPVYENTNVLAPIQLKITGWVRRKGDKWINNLVGSSYDRLKERLLLCLPAGGQQKEIIISKSDNKVLITDFDPARDYSVSVTAVSGSQQSRPLQGRHKGPLPVSLCWTSVLTLRHYLTPMKMSFFYAFLSFLVCHLSFHSLFLFFICQYNSLYITCK